MNCTYWSIDGHEETAIDVDSVGQFRFGELRSLSVRKTIGKKMKSYIWPIRLTSCTIWPLWAMNNVQKEEEEAAA